MAKPQKSMLSRFHAPVRAWFESSFDRPTRAQELGWPSIVAGLSTLILAPTGSGKTLAAFLAAIEKLMFAPTPQPKQRCRVLYVSPLKALAVDVERNLRAPLIGIAATARHLDAEVSAQLHLPTVDVRTGDTKASDRARMARHPPDILITTPESLYLVLTSSAREILTSVDTIIIDEIHSLVPTKRGAHLMLSVERLEALRREAREDAPPLQRIGLSATQRPLDEVARFLGGRSDGSFRPVHVVDAGERKAFDLKIEVPVDDMSRLSDAPLGDEIPSGPAAGALGPKSIWPSIHPRLLELIRTHRSTIVFVNSRRLAERLAAALNELATTEATGEPHRLVVGAMGTLARVGASRTPAQGPAGHEVEIALAHHGSIAREKRSEIEDRLKRGLLPAIVATSSLELGIDMGAVDLVIQIEAPPSVASAMQRIGRAGHSVGEISRGVIFPKFRGDLPAVAAVADRMRKGEVEETFYPRNPLDVLAQQIVAIAASNSKGIAVETLHAMVTSAAPFTDLPRASFEGVLDMLSGRYPSDEFAELRPRITWDRVGAMIRPRESAARLAILNGGTITDRGLYGVFLATGQEDAKRSRRVGELDEEMVFESRVGDVFLLGATSWRIEDITRDQVLVTPAPGEPGKMPFWHGDRPGRPSELGRAIGALMRTTLAMPRPQATKRLRDDLGFDARASSNLLQYLDEQREADSVIPSDETLVVERFIDEVGDYRVCILSPLGARIHAPWATAVTARLRDKLGMDVDVMWSDDGMAFRIPESDAPPDPSLFLPASEEIEEMVTTSVGSTSLFAARFRECASRALLLPRRHPQRRTPLWSQRKRAADLLAVASRHRSFPIMLETYRECLRDVFDLPGLRDTLRKIEQRAIRVVTVDVKTPSPFASSLLFAYVANFIYDGDTPLAERRAQALRVDFAQLRELLGEAELRELLDPEAIEEHERMLQRLDSRYPAKSADAVHDLLLSLGDLSRDEIARRADPELAITETLRTLERERRIAETKIGRSKRYIATEDVSRFRDALGIVPPRGLPIALLEPVHDPLGDLVGRYARTHGPFTAEAVAGRLSLPRATIERALENLARGGRVVQGSFLRGGRSREWCDAEVLRVLRRKSLARLRHEVEPVEPQAFARFLPEWQNVRSTSDREDAATATHASPELLLAAIEQLQGAPIPASVLESEVLPARVAGYRTGDLDSLLASGEVVWGGIEAIGATDGRIALYLAEHEALLARPPTPIAGVGMSVRIREMLERRGALFFSEIAREMGGFPNEVLEALWALVWSGEATNDTLAPLRARLHGTRETTKRAQRRGIVVPRSRLGTLPGSEGRWTLRGARGARVPTDTERRTALARSLLDRYGVLTREAVHAEGIETGFTSVYDVLKAMEEAGKVRRGYFIAGHGATQFAQPGADERLRAMRESSNGVEGQEAKTHVLAATDPANAYGATLPWPEREDAHPQRSAGASVILHDGALIGWLGRSEHALLVYAPAEDPQRSLVLHALANALASMVEDGRRKLLLVATVDGEPVERSPLAPYLREAGFLPGARGWLRRKTRLAANGAVSYGDGGVMA